MKIEVVDIEEIEVYPMMIRIKSRNSGFLDSDNITDILLGKICQQLELLLKKADKII